MGSEEGKGNKRVVREMMERREEEVVPSGIFGTVRILIVPFVH